MPADPIPTYEKPDVSIWYLFRFIKPYAFTVAVTTVFLIAGQVTESLEPIWLKKIIDGITGGSILAAVAGFITTYFILKAFSALFDYLRDVIFAPTEMGIARRLSEELFEHLLSLPVGYHSEQQLGGVSRKISRGSRAVTFILDFMVSNIIPTVFQLIFVTILLLHFYAPVYGITIFCTIVAYTAFTIWATEKRQKYRIAANKADDEVSTLEVDALSNIDTVKYFNSEPHLLQRYWPAITKRYDLSVTSNKLFAAVSAGQSLILLGGLGIVLYLGIVQAVNHTMTVGDLVLLTSYLVQLSTPIGVLGFIYRQIKDGLADLDGMVRILHEKPTILEPEHPQSITNPKGSVEFDHVQFKYATGRVVLKDVSLTVKPGEKVAFVGPSGVGKSTIVKLLFRLYNPTEGQIKVDGVPLGELSKDSRRDLLAIVPQEPALFNTTIGENIRFGKPGATDEEVEAAAKLANIHAFIEHLPLRYETVVGERGVKLSGGEKQRVAIARSIIRDPKILVFDEATSALDSHSEEIIQASLDRVAKGRTTIAIAHRLSTIINSDTIYVLRDGGIIEQGNHVELLAKQGVYAEMWKIQAEQKEEVAETIE